MGHKKHRTVEEHAAIKQAKAAQKDSIVAKNLAKKNADEHAILDTIHKNITTTLVTGGIIILTQEQTDLFTTVVEQFATIEKTGSMGNIVFTEEKFDFVTMLMKYQHTGKIYMYHHTADTMGIQCFTDDEHKNVMAMSDVIESITKECDIVNNLYIKYGETFNKPRAITPEKHVLLIPLLGKMIRSDKLSPIEESFVAILYNLIIRKNLNIKPTDDGKNLYITIVPVKVSDNEQDQDSTHVHGANCSHSHDHDQDHTHVHSATCNHDHDQDHTHVHSATCNHDHSDQDSQIVEDLTQQLFPDSETK